MLYCYLFRSGLIFKTKQVVTFDAGWKAKADEPIKGKLHSTVTGNIIAYPEEMSFTLNEVAVSWTEK